MLTKQTLMAIVLMRMEAEGLGWELVDFVWARDSLVAHARNACVGAFLKTDCTDLFFLDDDVACGPGVFSRLMTHEVEFCCGVYRGKSDPEKYFVRWLPGTKELRTDDHHGLLEVADAPLGFSRISREAIERMVKAAEDAGAWFIVANDGMRCWELFQTEVRDHQFVGEDFFFCRKYRETGGKVWVDVELPLVHVMPAFPGRPGREEDQLYRGHLGDFLRSKMT